jgi:hypothetical protein
MIAADGAVDFICNPLFSSRPVSAVTAAAAFEMPQSPWLDSIR